MSEKLAIGAVAILVAASVVGRRVGSGNAAMWGDLPLRFAHPYVSPSLRQLTSMQAEVRRVAYALKQGKVGEDHRLAGRQMAAVISDVSGPILVPVPGSSGSTRVNRKLAEAIASHIEGATVCDELSRHGGVQSSLKRRKRGLQSLGVPQHRMVSRGHCPGPMFLVDNVVTSGNTLRAAREAMGGGTGLVWAANFNPFKRGSRARPPGGLPLATITQHGLRFQTGSPVTVPFYRNTESGREHGIALQRGGMDLGIKVEPAGRYMSLRDPDYRPLPNWVEGEVSFSSPIVMEHISTSSTGWKGRLSKAFGGKTGKPLSRAIVDAGHDGIVTVAKGYRESDARYVSEIVDLTWLRLGSSNAGSDAKFKYWAACPDFHSGEIIDYINDPDRAVEITYKTFAKHVDLAPLREQDHPAMWRISSPDNWAVSFYRSSLPNGDRIYFFDWSRIEHIFIDPAKPWPSTREMAELAIEQQRGDP